MRKVTAMSRSVGLIGAMAVILGLAAWGGHVCAGHHAGLAVAGTQPAHEHADATGSAGPLEVALLDGADGSVAALHELHCHELGLARPLGRDAVLAKKPDESGADHRKRGSPGVAVAILDGNGQARFGPEVARVPRFSPEHVPKPDPFLATSRLLL